jgi:hypothetical protein
MTAGAEAQSKLEVAKNTHLYGNQAIATGRTEAAKIYAGGRVEAAQVQSGWRDAQTRQSYLNALVRAGGTVLAKKIGNVPFGSELTPEDAAAAANYISAGAGTTQAPAATAAPATPNATAAPAALAPTGKRPPPGWVKAQ